MNSGFCIRFSEGSLETYEKYTVYNKKGMNGFHFFFTSSRIFNFSFHHCMKFFLFNLLLILRVLDLNLYDCPYSLNLSFTAFKTPELQEALMNIKY